MRPSSSSISSQRATAPARSDAAAQQQSTGTGTQYRADADMQAMLDQLAALGGKPIETLSAEEARRQPTPADAVKALLQQQGRSTDPAELVPGVTSRDRTIPGAAGPLPARIYKPEGRGPHPVLLYFHGGGWVIADKEVYDAGARGFAAQANAVVVSVDYRCGPRKRNSQPPGTTRSPRTAGSQRMRAASAATRESSRLRARARAATSRSRPPSPRATRNCRSPRRSSLSIRARRPAT